MKSRTKPDSKAELSQQVMSYLGKVHRKEDSKSGRAVGRKDLGLRNSSLFKWMKRGTPSDQTPAPKVSATDEPALRVSNLLSKQAAKGGKVGDDYVTDENGTRWPKYGTMADTVTSYHNVFKSPIIASAFWGAIPALGYWGAHKFLNPDKEGTDTKRIEVLAAELLEADKANGGTPKGDYDYYIEKAKSQSAKNRWGTAFKVWLVGSAIAHLPYVSLDKPSMLYKFPKTKLEKQSSMLGSQMAMNFNDLQSAVAMNPVLAPSIKASALNALAYDPQPMMTSTNIINNAIYSGESAKTGLPIGRIIASSAVDAAVGYGLGKLFHVGSPKRAGLLAGIGSALYNALSYRNN